MDFDLKFKKLPYIQEFKLRIKILPGPILTQYWMIQFLCGKYRNFEDLKIVVKPCV